MLARHLLSQQDDVTPSDILAYSTLGTKTEDDDAIFESGGAIMEALEKVDPGIKAEMEHEKLRKEAAEKQKRISALQKTKAAKKVEKSKYINNIKVPEKMHLPTLDETSESPQGRANVNPLKKGSV